MGLLTTGVIVAGFLSVCVPTLAGTDGHLLMSAWVRNTELQLRPDEMTVFTVTLQPSQGDSDEE